MATNRYEFAGFRFSLVQGLEFQGRAIDLGPKQRQVLEILLSHGGRELPKEELIARAWPDEAVTDNCLYRCVHKLRRALIHPDGIEIIATAYNRGLRIMVPVVRAHQSLPDHFGRILRTDSIPAFEAWQQAREAMRQRTPADTEAALLALRMSAELDPRYLPAWSGQVECHIVQALRGDLSPREAARLGLLAARKAQSFCSEIDGDLLAASAWLKAAVEWQFDDGLADLKRAVQLNPWSWRIRYYRAWVLHVLGRNDDAFYELRTALALNPLASSAHALQGWMLFCGQRDQAALDHLLEATERMPQDDTLQMMLAVVAGALGRKRLALSAARRALEQSGRLPASLASLAYILARLGKTREARHTLEEAESARPIGAPAALLVPAWVTLGDSERALACLARARDERCPWFLAAHRDPRLAGLTHDPAYHHRPGNSRVWPPAAQETGVAPVWRATAPLDWLDEVTGKVNQPGPL